MINAKSTTCYTDYNTNELNKKFRAIRRYQSYQIQTDKMERKADGTVQKPVSLFF